jgi:cytidyltransferase-like protein
LSMRAVLVTGAFDDLGVRHVRLLHECSRVGEVVVGLWSDAAVSATTGSQPKFRFAERRYLLESLGFVNRVVSVEINRGPQWLPEEGAPKIDMVGCDLDGPSAELAAARAAAGALHAELRAFGDRELEGFPEIPVSSPDPSRRRVVVTGCFDWLHSGHVRFFAEVSGHGELYVVVGHDANVRLLKGEGHPRFPQDHRRYMAGSVRHVHQALVSSGSGWMDAEPEIAVVGAQVYAVNEDGDKPEKREFCRTHGLEYLVLKRVPAPGLPRRSSTDLRGF